MRQDAMTPRERFLAQMNGQEVDRCFRMEFGFWRETFRSWSMLRDNGIKNDAEAFAFFRFDPIVRYRPNLWLSPGFTPRILETRGEYNIVMNNEGLIAEVPRDAHDTIAHYLRSSVVTPDDWQRCKQEQLRRDDPVRRIDVAELRRRFPRERDFPVGVDCGSMIGVVRNLLTVEGLAYSCYDYPEMVEDMVETLCVLAEDFLDQVLGQVEFDYASGWEDICYKNGPLVAPEWFRRVVVPRYRRIDRKLRQAGIRLRYIDCDGDVRQLLPDLLGCGINCLLPWEVAGSGHPGAELDNHPDLRIMGGVDKRQFAFGRSAVRAMLESLVPWVRRGRYIPFLDHKWPPNISQEDFLYYLELKQELFG